MGARDDEERLRRGIEELSQADEAGTRRIVLAEGDRLAVHPEGQRTRTPIHGRVDDMDADLVWIAAKAGGLDLGDPVLVERALESDARYLTQGEVEVVSPDRFALRVAPIWQRMQERAHVRISIYDQKVRVTRSEVPEEEPPPRRRRSAGQRSEDGCALLDLSAGGLRFNGDPSFLRGESLVCHFELPGSSCFVLPAEVVNVQPGEPGPRGDRWVAVRFTQVDDQTESSLMRWIFYEQIRRHMREKGDPEAG